MNRSRPDARRSQSADHGTGICHRAWCMPKPARRDLWMAACDALHLPPALLDAGPRRHRRNQLPARTGRATSANLICCGSCARLSAHDPNPAANTPRPMATGCPANSNATPARGCCGLNGSTTGATAPLPAQHAFAAVAAAIAQFEPVSVGVSAATVRVRARAARCACTRHRNQQQRSAWMRDVGPTFVVNAAGKRRAVDWQFNAWGGLNGGLYFPWDQDDLVAQKVAAVEGARSLSRHSSWKAAPSMQTGRARCWSPSNAC